MDAEKGFSVLDLETGKAPDLNTLYYEDWTRALCGEIEGFGVHEFGSLILLDQTGNFTYCPPGRFKIIFKE